MQVFAQLGLAETVPAVSGRTIETKESEIIRRLAERLRTDAEVRQSVAQRILSSSLAPYLSRTSNTSSLEGAMDRWVEDHPRDAAALAVGFAKDDQDGTQEFERSLYVRMERYFELNPDRYKGILGVLAEAGAQSKTILKQIRKLSEEEQQELLKRVFEGKDSGISNALKPPKGGRDNTTFGDGDPSGTAVAAKAMDVGIYDRLRADNPTGYSPQVVAFQSALNSQRAPGMPKLLETGKLDYQTLVYPHLILSHDLQRLEAEMRRHEAWAATHPVGSTDSFHSRFSLRRRFLARASQALEALKKKAEETRDPSRITRETLRSLGDKQKEAARWITAASIEADLQSWESRQDFLTEELQRQVLSAPMPEDVRRAYWVRGLEFRERLEQVKKSDAAALIILESSDYLKRWAEMEKLLASASTFRKNLDRTISIYSTIPSQLDEARRPKSRWRQWLNRWMKRLLPNSLYVRRINQQERRLTEIQTSFNSIAAGRF